jgi:hypothetical protein
MIFLFISGVNGIFQSSEFRKEIITENLAKFKYVETTVTNKNYIHVEVKNRLN